MPLRTSASYIFIFFFFLALYRNKYIADEILCVYVQYSVKVKKKKEEKKNP